MQNIEVTSVEELKKYIGQEVSVGQWVLVTQEMVNQFADATGDHQFIHVDPERAAKTMFGGTIAHGYYTLSMLAGHLGQNSTGVKMKLGGRMGVNYGLNKVRFIAPVPVGKKIRARRKLIAVEEDPNKRWVQMTSEASVEVEGSDRPAMIAETIGRT
ncbi:MAG: MaoC family dehydratase, partial [Chloroflexi bacterium]|nr:MaoC family dehydratase [Chloroflexota bacterium]